MLKALSVLEIFTFFSRLFGYVGKQLDKVNFKIYDVTDWATNNYNTYCPISPDERLSGNKIGQLIKYNVRIIFI